MKVYKTNEIKNFTLLGNGGSGKTTFSEAILFEGGIVKRRGDIASKNTVSDNREIEHAQEGSIFSTVLYAEWNGKKLNFIDTPGADDFIGGAVSSMYATDLAIMLLNSQNGVEVGTESHWREANRMHKPLIFVVNHLDHDKSNFDKTIEEVRNNLTPKAVIVQYPVNVGPEFDAVIDLLKMKMLKWSKDGGKAQELDIPASEADKAEELQNSLMEAAAESDEELMEIFFEKETLTEEEMRKGIKQGLAKRDLFPIFCISARQNYGVQRVMDFISNAAPSPDEVICSIQPEDQEIVCDPSGKLSMFVFKNTIEQHLGEVLYFRVVSGTLKEGVDLINQSNSAKERLSQIFVVAGKSRTKVAELYAGDLGATVKLKDTKTNHTLAEKAADWVYSTMAFPPSKFRVAIKALSESDDEKLGEVLHKIAEEDPTVRLEYSKELKQLILHGQGEYHINLMVKWQLENTYKLESEFLPPRIPYRETITKGAQASYRHKKQSGGAGQFGEVHLYIDPFEEGKPDPTEVKISGKDQKLSVRDKQQFDMPWGGKLVYYNCIVGGVIDARFMPAILKGIMEKMEQGPLTGCYARDIRVAVYDGKMHPVDSNEISFKLAGAKAFSEAFKNAGPKIMEPVYDVEIRVPSEKMGDVMSDLQGRRAVIQGMENQGRYEILKTRMPLAEMSKYSTVLSSITSGRATFNMKFNEYSPIPFDVQDELLKAYAAEQNDD